MLFIRVPETSVPTPVQMKYRQPCICPLCDGSADATQRDEGEAAGGSGVGGRTTAVVKRGVTSSSQQASKKSRGG